MSLFFYPLFCSIRRYIIGTWRNRYPVTCIIHLTGNTRRSRNNGSWNVTLSIFCGSSNNRTWSISNRINRRRINNRFSRIYRLYRICGLRIINRLYLINGFSSIPATWFRINYGMFNGSLNVVRLRILISISYRLYRISRFSIINRLLSNRRSRNSGLFNTTAIINCRSSS
jgi:hypothetical protein